MLFDLFRGFTQRLLSVSAIPVVRADDDDDDEEELYDHQVGLRIECGKHKEALEIKEKWDACTKRVLSRKKTKETCEEELHEYFKYVDECVAETLFDHLK